MAKKCKHPKKYVVETKENSYTDTGYGTDRYITVINLKCKKCGEIGPEICTWYSTYPQGTVSWDEGYELFTGRNANKDFKQKRMKIDIQIAKEDIERAKRKLKEVIKFWKSI